MNINGLVAVGAKVNKFIAVFDSDVKLTAIANVIAGDECITRLGADGTGREGNGGLTGAITEDDAVILAVQDCIVGNDGTSGGTDLAVDADAIAITFRWIGRLFAVDEITNEL